MYHVHTVEVIFTPDKEVYLHISFRFSQVPDCFKVQVILVDPSMLSENTVKFTERHRAY